MDNQNTELILRDIEDKLFSRLHSFIDPEVIAVLDDPNAEQRDIEQLKTKIDPEIIGRLFSMANAAYSGKLRSGALNNFYEVVFRLGVEHTKLFIIFFSLPQVGGDREGDVLIAKSFARYIVAGTLFAREFRLSAREKKELELGALLYEVGKILFRSFQHIFPYEYLEHGIDDAFVSAHHRRLGIYFCKTFALPEYLPEIIDAQYFTLETEYISISGVVMMTHFLVEAIFSASANRLIIQSPMPDSLDVLTHSLGVVIRDLFHSAGMSKYLVIHTALTPIQLDNKVHTII